MKTISMACLALLVAAAPAWSQGAKGGDLPAGCKALIADARACIPAGTAPEVVARINHVLDMMADNIRTAEPSQRPELCQATVMSYRQMANLVCAR